MLPPPRIPVANEGAWGLPPSKNGRPLEKGHCYCEGANTQVITTHFLGHPSTRFRVRLKPIHLRFSSAKVKRSAIEESAATDMQQLLKRLASPDFSTNKNNPKQENTWHKNQVFMLDLICQNMLLFFPGLEKNSSFVPFSPVKKNGEKWEVQWPGLFFLELRGGFFGSPIFNLPIHWGSEDVKKKIDSFKQAETDHGFNRLTWGLCLGGVWDVFFAPKKMVTWWVVWLMEGCAPQNDFKDEFRFRNCRMICPDDEFVVCEVCDQLKQGPCLWMLFCIGDEMYS